MRSRLGAIRALFWRLGAAFGAGQAGHGHLPVGLAVLQSASTSTISCGLFPLAGNPGCGRWADLHPARPERRGHDLPPGRALFFLAGGDLRQIAPLCWRWRLAGSWCQFSSTGSDAPGILPGRLAGPAPDFYHVPPIPRSLCKRRLVGRRNRPTPDQAHRSARATHRQHFCGHWRGDWAFSARRP